MIASKITAVARLTQGAYIVRAEDRCHRIGQGAGPNWRLVMPNGSQDIDDRTVQALLDEGELVRVDAAYGYEAYELARPPKDEPRCPGCGGTAGWCEAASPLCWDSHGLGTPMPRREGQENS